MDEHYGEAQTNAIAQLLLDNLTPSDTMATIVALQGDLGAGKTTLTRSIGGLLGVKEQIISPTFVIAKYYESASDQWTKLVHIDAYRIESIDELGPIGFAELIRDNKTLVIIEWPENIRSAIPEATRWFSINHNGETRHIKNI